MPSPFQMNTFQNSVSNVTMPGFQVTDVGPAQPTGGVGAPHQLSRRRRRELTKLLFAADAARDRAMRFTKRSKRDALLNAVDRAKQAIAAASALDPDTATETARLDRIIAANIELLRSATRTSNEIKLIRQAEAAERLSQQIILAREAEEEEDMINLVLLS